MILPGTYNTLRVGAPTDGGVLLQDATSGAVLLPEQEYETTPVSGRYMQVFVYHNNEGALTATVKKPHLALGEVGFLEIKSITNAGAFADWGIARDVFIPFKEQTQPLFEGQKYIFFLYIDETSGRLAGSMRLNKHLNNDEQDLEVGDSVELLIGEKTDLGVNVIVNGQYLGLIYHNEIFKDINYGEKTRGFVKELRPNNRIDISLQKLGYESVTDGSHEILTLMEKNRGFLGLTDASSPEEIKAKLGISKKMFKKAIGQLYRQRVITLHPDGIRLTDAE